jgi:hypothetical protein
MSKARQLIEQALAPKGGKGVNRIGTIYGFTRGTDFSPDPINPSDHLNLYSSIVQLLKPSRTVKRSIGAALIYLFLDISREFYGSGDGSYSTQSRIGRTQMKEQLQSYQRSLSALEVVFHDNGTSDGAKATVGRFDEHSTRHELEDILDLVRTSTWKTPGSYEIVYAQSPGDLVSEDGREDIVIGSSGYKIEQTIQAHVEHFRTDETVGYEMPGKTFNHLFTGGGSYKEAYERVNQYLTDFEGFPDEVRTRLEDYKKKYH